MSAQVAICGDDSEPYTVSIEVIATAVCDSCENARRNALMITFTPEGYTSPESMMCPSCFSESVDELKIM